MTLWTSNILCILGSCSLHWILWALAPLALLLALPLISVPYFTSLHRGGGLTHHNTIPSIHLHLLVPL